MEYRHKRLRILNNKGFSIVELVVAFAILALTGTAVFGFMTVSARTFSKTSAEVNVQNETQVAFNQIQDMLVDATIGVEYGYLANQTAPLVKADDASMPAAYYAKELVIYSTDKVYEVDWVRDSSDITQSKLYLSEYGTVLNSGKVVKATPKYEDALLAEYVTDFSVDLSELEDSRIIRLALAYEKDGKTYNSNHNVTLRNTILSGNQIPEVTQITVDSNDKPVSIEGGADEYYLEPGDSFTLKTQGFYVKLESGTQDYGNLIYSKADVNSWDYGTQIDSTTGNIIVGKGQNSDFAVRITSNYTQNNVSRVVTIHLIKVTGVSVSFNSLTASALNETEESLDMNLAENEDFELVATVNGSNLDKVSSLGNTVSTAVNWEITDGAECFDIISTDNRGNNTYGCICKMKDILTISGDVNAQDRYLKKDVSVTATSVRSIDASKPYYKANTTTGAKAPVVGKWTGQACKRKGDFNIHFDSKNDYRRGKEYALQVLDRSASVDIYDGMSMPDGEALDLSKYVGLLDCRMVMSVANMDGTYTDTVMDVSQDSTSSGMHWTFKCPYSYDPNASFSYMFTLHLAECKGADTPGQIYLLPKSGYSAADYKYTSNTVTCLFDAIKLSYTNTTNNTNVVVTSNLSNVEYYPRSFGTAAPPANVSIKYSPNSAFEEASKYITEWRLYSYKEVEGTDTSIEEGTDLGAYALYDDSTVYSGGKLSDLSKFFTVTGGVNDTIVKFRFTRNKWNDDVDSRLRLVPVYKFDDKEYILFKNYMDIFFWNIYVMPSDSTVKLALHELFGFDNGEATYFPVPNDSTLDVKFPEETSSQKSWIGPFTNSKYPDTLRYTLEGSANVGGTKNYILTLYYYDNKSANWRLLESYICRPGDISWSVY